MKKKPSSLVSPIWTFKYLAIFLPSFGRTPRESSSTLSPGAEAHNKPQACKKEVVAPRNSWESWSPWSTSGFCMFFADNFASQGALGQKGDTMQIFQKNGTQRCLCKISQYSLHLMVLKNVCMLKVFFGRYWVWVYMELPRKASLKWQMNSFVNPVGTVNEQILSFMNYIYIWIYAVQLRIQEKFKKMTN